MGEIRNLSQLIHALQKGYKVTEKGQDQKELQYAAHDLKKEERHFCVSLAGHVIEINSLYTEVYHLCKEYICDDQPEICITISEEDISRERTEAKKAEIISSESYLETLAVYRKICAELLDYDTYLMHGAVIAHGQRAFMFTAKSGTGKTTHIRKWLKQLEGSYVVNGDKPLINVEKNEIMACGTPWCGKENLGMNIIVPLKAIVLMERGEDNHISEIAFGEAFAFLLQQTYQPEGTDKIKKTLQLLSRLKGKVRFYKFIFNNMKDDAFEVSYNTLTGGNI